MVSRQTTFTSSGVIKRYVGLECRTRFPIFFAYFEPTSPTMSEICDRHSGISGWRHVSFRPFCLATGTRLLIPGSPDETTKSLVSLLTKQRKTGIRNASMQPRN